MLRRYLWSWLALMWFILVHMRARRSLLWLSITCAASIAAAAFAMADFWKGAVAAAAVGLFSFAKEAASALRFMAGDWKTCVAPSETLLRTVQGLGVPTPLVSHEYVILDTPRSKVLWSAAVDKYIRHKATDIATARSTDARRNFNDTLRSRDNVARSDFVEQVLRHKQLESSFRCPPRLLQNDAKLCLYSDMLVGTQKVEVFKATYFHGLLSNDAVGLRTIAASDGSTSFDGGTAPFYPEAREREHAVLKPLPHSEMANAIGVSTLAITDDKALVIWQQSQRAQQSQSLLAPSGSGSCDWTDFSPRWTPVPRRVSLAVTLTRAMERELFEESDIKGRPADRQRISETRVLGHFRWLSRGGKPEFVGVTRLRVSSDRLAPQQREVLRTRELIFVADRSALETALQNIMTRPDASVPLWMSAHVLLQSLDTDLEALLFA